MPQGEISLAEEQRSKGECQPPRRSDIALAILDLGLRDEAVRSLIDDWIVPALVEQFFHHLHTPSEGQEEHNRCP